jgi:hypothetical protein
VFPIASEVVVLFWAAAAAAGMVIGLLCAFLLARVLKLETMGVWKDALLGGIGVLVGFIVAIKMPWPENSVSSVASDGRVVQTTMHQFQHPFVVAYIFAGVLPTLHQLWRLRQQRQTGR